MSDSTTIARPYAKAIFEYALGEKKLAEWSDHLLNLAQAVLIPKRKNLSLIQHNSCATY